MSKRFNRGFTLIELLVVIAIIGILSSVVLASLNTARGKGANAAVKSNLQSLKVQSVLYSDTHQNGFSNTSSATFMALGVCPTVITANTNFIQEDAIVQGAIAEAVKQSGGIVGNSACALSYDSWATAVGLRSGYNAAPASVTSSYCVDSTGVAKVEPFAANASIQGAGTLASPYACK